MIIQFTDRPLLRLYRCGRCERVFSALPSFFEAPNTTRPHCAVNHPPGACCHYGERLVSDALARDVLELVETQSSPAPPEE
jgi:hypothetical protein